MPFTELTSQLGIKSAAHLLRRTCFGGSPEEIDTFSSLTPAEAVSRLFSSDLPSPPLPVDPLTGQNWIENAEASEPNDLMSLFLTWSLGQMVGSELDDTVKLPYIFRERLVYFLHVHFTTQRGTVNDTRALYYQQALFRLFAFDGEDIIIPTEFPEEEEDTIVARNFKQLTKKISVDNAMLIFLDGRLNVKGSPNENYARELLELYSAGRGLEGSNPEPEFDGDYYTFTEQDVQAGAQVLSGFDRDKNFQNIDEETGLPRGVVKGGNIANRHEGGTKTFSARLGDGSVIPDPKLMIGDNPTEASVLDEISQFVDIIYNQNETAIHICRELYRFFVYHQVDDTLQAGVIQDMANIFKANDFKIQPVLEALFTSEHFYGEGAGLADDSFGGLIKSPIEMVIGYHRNFNIPLPDYSTDLNSYNEYVGSLLRILNDQGMDYYEPYEVAGYAAYHQFPIFNRSWITTNYLTNRYNFIRSVISSDSEGLETGQVYILQFVEDNFPISVIRIPNDFIITIARYFLPLAEDLSFETTAGGELTAERLNYFKVVMFSFEIDADPEATWTLRWDNGFDPETRANQLKDLFNGMLQTPEYQLM